MSYYRMQRRIQPEDISVAIIHPGNRVDKLTVPLKASRMDVAVDPPDAYHHDIVLVDNADRLLGIEVLRNKFHDSTLVYRMRGDVFHELDLWGMHPVKEWVARNLVLGNVDAAVCITERLGAKYSAKTGVPVGTAHLAKVPSEWPTVTHEDHELRAVTLTNMNYWRKIQPITKFAPVVDDVLDSVGGQWRVCGAGDHSDRLANALEHYDNITFAGYVDAYDTLASSNIMLHPTGLDAFPNAVLEGLASRLPVVSNDWIEFTRYDGPILTHGSENGLRDELHELTDPAARERAGAKGEEYVAKYHAPEVIGEQYERFFSDLLTP